MAGETQANQMAGGAAPQQGAPAAAQQTAPGNNNIMFLFAYFLTFLSGIIVFIISSTDKRLKTHGMQALILGVVIVILAIISDVIVGLTVAASALTPYSYNPAAFGIASIVGGVFGLVEFLIWVYGMYVGYQAYNGKDMEIPVVSNLARSFVK